jgi:hypothetical protein
MKFDEIWWNFHILERDVSATLQLFDDLVNNIQWTSILSIWWKFNIFDN